MNKTARDKLHSVIKEVLGVEIADDLSMNTVSSWDSLRHLQLMAKIEEEFGLELDFKDTLAMTSLKSIVTVLEKYVGQK